MADPAAPAGAVLSDRIRVRGPAVRPIPRTRHRVSVVITCFNYIDYLPAAITSALHQRDVDVEVIVVDDASTDGSARVAADLAEGDKRVRVLALGRNRGPVGAFNAGLELVSAPFLVRLDADDLLTPGSLARAAALAESFPSVSLVYGHPKHFTGAPPAPRLVLRSWTVTPGWQWFTDRTRNGLNVITSPEAFMRSDPVVSTGGFRDLAHTHDMELWFRLATLGDVGHIEGPDQALHREHGRSLSARSVDLVADVRNRRAAFDVLFAELPATPRVAAARRAATIALAREALARACHLYDRGRATPQEVADYVNIATELAQDEPAVADLPGWRSLRMRQRAGEHASRNPVFLAAAARRGLSYRYARWRWQTTGR